MTVYDLNRDQLQELKQRYYIDYIDDSPDYYTLANIDEFVSDEEVYNEWANTEFSPDDFASSSDEEYEDEEYSFSSDLSGTPEYIAEQLRLIANDIENGNYGGLAGGYGASWGLEKI